MAIEHVDISDPEIHEPKGISAASLNTAYIANGSGSGTWKKVGVPQLAGISTDGGSDNLRLVTDGSQGFTLKTNSAYGVMAVTNNSTGFTVSAATDPTLIATSDYVLFSGTGAPWAGETLYGVTFNTNRLIAPVAGVYDIRMWSQVSGFPSTSSFVGARFKVNNTTFSPRTIIIKSNSNGDAGNLNGFGLVQLAANDYVQLFVAATAAGSLVIRNVNLTMELKRAL